MTRERFLLIGRKGARTMAARFDGRELADFVCDPDPATAGPGPGDILTATLGRPAGAGAIFAKTDDGIALRVRDADGLAQGTRHHVQVAAEAEPGKALPASVRILLKSRRVIFTPDAPGVNVSRKIADGAERTRLGAALAPLAGAGGFILRTMAAGASAEALRSEAEMLLARHAALGTGRMRSAAEIAESEWTDPLPAWIGYHGGAEPGLAELDAIAREGREDPFEHFGVWETLTALAAPDVDLPGGGSMFVEPTRALVAVDVNTGGDFSPAAGFKANLAALRELPRQLRLRGLGGQIVIGPAPMAKSARAQAEGAFRAALRDDPVETSIAGWTTLGLLEVQRKRERRPLALTLRGLGP